MLVDVRWTSGTTHAQVDAVTRMLDHWQLSTLADDDDEPRSLYTELTEHRCGHCWHAPHPPGRCGVNVGTGYMGPVPCRCGTTQE